VRWISVGSLIVVIVSCGGTVTRSEAENSGSGGSSIALCPSASCDAQATPTHQCVGGVPSPVCAQLAEGSCRKQLDCVTAAPGDPRNLGGVSPCEVARCGPLPTYDPLDCVYGFTAAPAQCESYDRAACAWTKRCKPKPCAPEKGECNSLDRSRLGEPCGVDKQCPVGSSCVSITIGIDDRVPPTCVSGDPCTALTCAAGASCSIAESYPGQVSCHKR
jgi:hypothetical protein